MTLLLTCAQVTDHLTDYSEGATPLLLGWRLRTHLSLCPGCQAMLRSLQGLPQLLRAALAPAPEPPSEAQAALRGALARLGQPRPHHSAGVPEALAGTPLVGLHGLLARARAALLAGTASPVAPFLPAEVLADLPPHPSWSWWGLGLGGGRIAKLKASEDGRQEVYLLEMPPGGRFPLHGHAGPESLLVLHGGLEDGLRHGNPGDWFHHTGDHPDHAPLADATGCWALIWVETGAVHLRGWRRLPQMLLS